MNRSENGAFDGGKKGEKMEQVLERIDDAAWGPILILLILGTGLYFSVRLKFLQIRRLGKAMKFTVQNEAGATGEVSSFGALCTSLSATIGTGNIIGVATAIVSGGPGALFWMIVAAFLGMAVKYAEGLLAVKYRVVDENGHVLGGPFYYIENGMGKKWKWLAKLFAFFGVCAGLFGIGTFAQVNGITAAAENFFDPEKSRVLLIFGVSYPVSVVVAGAVVTVCTGIVLIGGIRRIAGVSQIVVPVMAGVYIFLCLLLLIMNFRLIPAAVGTILQSAFGLRGVLGGAVGTVTAAVQKGVARGIFSNEAGLGSAPIAAAAAQTKEPVRQGLVSMTGTFLDTVVICTMTGLCIVITGAQNLGLEGFAVTTAAFQAGLRFAPDAVSFLLMLCLAFFAFTTILGWDYYSERCLEYLCGGGQKTLKAFRVLYLTAVTIGPYFTVSAVFTIADIFNACMAVPNLIALLALSGVVVAETKKYFFGFP